MIGVRVVKSLYVWLGWLGVILGVGALVAILVFAGGILPALLAGFPAMQTADARLGYQFVVVLLVFGVVAWTLATTLPLFAVWAVLTALCTIHDQRQ